MIYSTKISNISFNLSDNDIRRSSNTKSYTQIQKYGKSFVGKNLLPSYTYEIENSNDIIDLLPKSVLDQERPSLIYIELISTFDSLAYLPPHIDIKRKSSINYYLNTNQEQTKFYDWDPMAKKLTEVEEFTAEDNECWALDVSTPHSVTFFKPCIRKFLSFSFSKISFKDLVNLTYERV